MWEWFDSDFDYEDCTYDVLYDGLRKGEAVRRGGVWLSDMSSVLRIKKNIHRFGQVITTASKQQAKSLPLP